MCLLRIFVNLVRAGNLCLFPFPLFQNPIAILICVELGDTDGLIQDQKLL